MDDVFYGKRLLPKHTLHRPCFSRAGGEQIPLLSLNALSIIRLPQNGLALPLKCSLDLLKIRLCVIKNDRRCLAYGIGFYGFYAVNPRHGNPYRGGRIPSNTPRNLDNHSFFSGKNAVVGPKKQHQNCHQRQCHHPLPSHTVSSFIIRSFYYKSERQKVQKIPVSLSIPLNSANNGTNLS